MDLLLSPPKEAAAAAADLVKPREEVLRKVCLTVRASFGAYDVSTIYVVDLNDSPPPADADSFPELTSPDCPVVASFRLQHGYTDALCVFGGSTLYKIDGIDVDNQEENKTAVYTCDLPLSCNGFDVELNAKMLQVVPPMNHPKFHPEAVPTPDGKKLLVFSVFAGVFDEDFLWDSAESEIVGTGFELYDPAVGKWRELPKLKLRKKEDVDCCKIAFYSFLSESIFFIQTDDGDMFSIDLESLDSDWEQVDRFLGYGHAGPSYSSFGGPCILAIDRDGLCLTGYALCDLKLEKFSPFPERLPELVSQFYSSNRAVCVLDNVGDDGVCKFCVSDIKRDYKTKVAKLFIDVYVCETEKYKEGVQNGKGNLAAVIPGTTIIKSFKVCLNIEAPSPFLEFYSCSI